MQGPTPYFTWYRKSDKSLSKICFASLLSPSHHSYSVFLQTEIVNRLSLQQVNRKAAYISHCSNCSMCLTFQLLVAVQCMKFSSWKKCHMLCVTIVTCHNMSNSLFQTYNMQTVCTLYVCNRQFDMWHAWRKWLTVSIFSPPWEPLCFMFQDYHMYYFNIGLWSVYLGPSVAIYIVQIQ